LARAGPSAINPLLRKQAAYALWRTNRIVIKLSFEPAHRIFLFFAGALGAESTLSRAAEVSSLPRAIVYRRSAHPR